MTQASLFSVFDFTLTPVNPFRDILLAELVELGFDSFEETTSGLKAYALQKKLPTDWWDTVQVRHLAGVEIHFTKEEVPDINWNEEWEKQFDPIELGQRCRVRADFHPYKKVEHDLIISPKMSFGTGHHQTTYMMLEFLLEAQLKGLPLLDMGCGTGVLAILAAQKGAIEIQAVDIDHWAVENAKENILLNNASVIQVQQGDAEVLGSWTNRFQWILANINRNILLQDIPAYTRCLKKEGVLLLSGFYTEDLPLIHKTCEAQGGRLEKKRERDNWVAAKYVF